MLCSKCESQITLPVLDEVESEILPSHEQQHGSFPSTADIEKIRTPISELASQVSTFDDEISSLASVLHKVQMQRDILQ